MKYNNKKDRLGNSADENKFNVNYNVKTSIITPKWGNYSMG